LLFTATLAAFPTFLEIPFALMMGPQISAGSVRFGETRASVNSDGRSIAGPAKIRPPSGAVDIPGSMDHCDAGRLSRSEIVKQSVSGCLGLNASATSRVSQ
jgi:hypothetical protein